MCAGALPYEFPQSLTTLSLGEYSNKTNSFTGGLPPEWGNLTHLSELTLSNCGLEGRCISCLSIFTENGDSRSCAPGSLPEELGALVNLTCLYANANSLSGEMCEATVFVICA